MHRCADRSLGKEEMDHQLVVSMVQNGPKGNRAQGQEEGETGENRGKGRTWVPSNIV
jgi:hypothetical protein